MFNKLINVYDRFGCVRDVFSLPKSLNWMEGRLSVDTYGLYYKGSGALYTHHYTSDLQEYRNPSFLPGDVRVINPHLYNKFGFFLLPYSPVFDEMIGGCGARENNIINNSLYFEMSDVEVLDKLPSFDSNHSIFILNYFNKRKKYTVEPNPEMLLNLISYMMSSHWNMPWNKKAIRDVTPNGTVTDVSDLFISDNFIHKVGTVFALVTSLCEDNYVAYIDLKRAVGHELAFTDLGVSGSILRRVPDDCILLTVSILQRWYDINIDLPLTRKCFFDFISNYILPGRNYAYGEHLNWGDVLRQSYINYFINSVVV